MTTKEETTAEIIWQVLYALTKIESQSFRATKIPLYFWHQRWPSLGKFSMCTPPPPRREKIPLKLLK